MPISDTIFRPGLAVLLSQNPVEPHDASECSGASGDANRVLTITKTIFNSTIVQVDGVIMNHVSQITITGQDITFIDPLFDESKIEVY